MPPDPPAFGGVGDRARVQGSLLERLRRRDVWDRPTFAYHHAGHRATKVDHGVGHDETQLHQFCDCRFRQDYEIGVFAVFDPPAQGACRSEIEVQLVARLRSNSAPSPDTTDLTAPALMTLISAT